MLKRVILTGLILVATATAASAQATIFLVRHAERADGGSGGMGNDPSLSEAGRARAESLASMLTDAKLAAIFTTEFTRTQETAAPTATAQHLTAMTVKADQTAALVAKLKAAKGAVLVVGHSNTVPEVMTALGVKPAVTIADTEFDNLFIVTTGAKPTVVRLRYK
ncbi:MAG: phosphoglycerate mutase family protein [Vicinamibacterales bacterium]